MSISIFSRYSCRNFNAKTITDEQIKTIIKAGMSAPSAKNECPWEFLIVRSEEGRAKIAGASPYAKSCLQAPAVIVALANLNRISKDSPWWVQDMSACVENMLLEITELGLGGVWLGMYPREDRAACIQQAFNLDPSLIPFAAIPVGYPEHDHTAAKAFEENRIHWE